MRGRRAADRRRSSDPLSTSKLPVAGGELLDDLVEAGQLYRAGDRYFWAGEGSPPPRHEPAHRLPGSRRDPDGRRAGRPQVIGELDRDSAPLLLYEGAIYLHEGQTYLVERLDWEAGIAHVKPVEVDFYTRPIIGEKIEVLATKTNDERRTTDDEPCTHPTRKRQLSIDLPASSLQLPTLQPPASSFQSAWGDVRVISQATGYKIIRARQPTKCWGSARSTCRSRRSRPRRAGWRFRRTLIERLKAAGAWFSDPNEYGPNWPAQRDAARAPRRLSAARAAARSRWTAGSTTSTIASPSAPSWPIPACAAAWRQNRLAGRQRLENLVTLCRACHRRAEASVRIRSGLGGAAALLAGVAPLFLMCDPRDLGVLAEPQDPASGQPTITIYERTPGGVGYAEQLYRSMPDLLAAAYDLVTACPCERGCPALRRAGAGARLCAGYEGAGRGAAAGNV